MIIPKKLNLIGRTIKIEFDKSLAKDNDYGSCDVDKGVIKIVPLEDCVIEINKEQQDIVFWHEIIHYIFKIMSYNDYYTDEQLIDRLAESLYQIVNQIIDINKCNCKKDHDNGKI